MIFRYLVLLVLINLNISLFSQTLTSNPYSYFGLGFIENTGFAENIASGSSGIAMPSEGFLNPLNPASYSAIDSLGFYLDLGLYGKQSQLQSGGIKHNIFDSNIKYLTIGFKAAKRWGTSIGITPFSSRGYLVTSTYPTEGDLSDYILTSTGSGSISRFYIGNSFLLTKNISLGANVSYLFGMLKNEESVFYSDATFNGIVNTSTNYFNNFYFDFGLQYNIKIAKNSYYFGITYNPSQNLKADYERLLTNGSDTLYYKSKGSKDFVLPSSIGLGLGLKINDKLKLMADYKTMFWSESDYSYNSVKLNNSFQLNAGAEYIHDNKTGRSFWDYVNYRAGFRFEKTYLTIGDNNLDEMAFTIGLGLPIKRTTVNVSYEYGIIGTISNSGIRENYHRINLGFSLKDWWFQKKKFY